MSVFAPVRGLWRKWAQSSLEVVLPHPFCPTIGIIALIIMCTRVLACLVCCGVPNTRSNHILVPAEYWANLSCFCTTKQMRLQKGIDQLHYSPNSHTPLQRFSHLASRLWPVYSRRQTNLSSQTAQYDRKEKEPLNEPSLLDIGTTNTHSSFQSSLDALSWTHIVSQAHGGKQRCGKALEGGVTWDQIFRKNDIFGFLTTTAR